MIVGARSQTIQPFKCRLIGRNFQLAAILIGMLRAASLPTPRTNRTGNVRPPIA